MKRILLSVLFCALAGCQGSDSHTSDIVHNSSIVRICPDGAVVLTYNGKGDKFKRMWRWFGQKPTFYAPEISLERTCIENNGD